MAFDSTIFKKLQWKRFWSSIKHPSTSRRTSVCWYGMHSTICSTAQSVTKYFCSQSKAFLFQLLLCTLCEITNYYNAPYTTNVSQCFSNKKEDFPSRKKTDVEECKITQKRSGFFIHCATINYNIDGTMALKPSQLKSDCKNNLAQQIMCWQVILITTE